MRAHRLQALYGLYRVYYLWNTFSNLHATGLAITVLLYLALYFFLSKSASPKYAPLAQGGALVSAGVDLNQEGVIEYTWDMLYVTLFVQLATAFISDWFWLLHAVPPSIGFYMLWIKVIYPWISRPDAEPADVAGSGRGGKGEKQKVKYGKAR